MNPIFMIDFYKVGHVSQYPPDTEYVISNWTPRRSRTQESTVVHFGLNYFLKYMGGAFNYEFFARPWGEIEREYKKQIRAALGVANPKVDHIRALHELGYLPLRFWSLPEGSSVPMGVPAVVLTNTLPEFFWLPNYIESLMSCMLWGPSTSATTARSFRRLFERYASEFGETDLSFCQWQGHDFAFRGMFGVEAAILSGMGHLTSFSGTDTIPGLLAAQEYYHALPGVGGSVPATEHSVMCAGTKEGEFETFKRLITEVYPTGVVSIVSDTWDLWKVLTDYMPRLRDTILARDGKVVIRPDSGDPVKIMIGDESAPADSPQRKGVVQLLSEVMGTDGKGHINKAGAIYGDSITLERAEAILRGCIAKGLSPFNCVFGIGSYTYQYVTRDVYSFAMKATAVIRGGELVPIFKNPVTDDGEKKSHKGIVCAFADEFSTPENPTYFAVDERRPIDLDSCAFQRVWENGHLLVDPTFEEIRKRVQSVPSNAARR